MALTVALGLCVALLGMLVVGLLRSHAEILKALHDLGVNLEGEEGGRRVQAAPVDAAGVAQPRPGPLGEAQDISGELPSGGAGSVTVRDVEHETLIAFLSTGCGTCGELWRTLDTFDPAKRLGRDARVVVVTQGPETESPPLVQDMAPTGAVTLMSSAAWDAYNVPVSPYFVLVDGRSNQVIGEGAGSSWDQVLGLLGKARSEQAANRRRGLRGNGAQRAAQIDQTLLSAGIQPGDPSLYPREDQP